MCTGRHTLAPARAAAIILAAGASTRLGEPKQLVRLGAETLLERVIRIAGESGASPIVVVLGASAERVREQMPSDLTARFLLNPDWEEGMASSIRHGVAAVQGMQIAGALILTCDQPAVTSDHLRSLMERAPLEATASSYQGRHGVPAYFPAADFSQLLSLRRDHGARELLRFAASLELVNGELDVDTPESLKLVREHFAGRVAPTR